MIAPWAEKLKSREMKEGWMKNDDFKLLRGFDLWQTDWRTNKWMDICDCRVAFATENQVQKLDLDVLRKKNSYYRILRYVSNVFNYFTITYYYYSIFFQSCIISIVCVSTHTYMPLLITCAAAQCFFMKHWQNTNILF